MEEKYGIHLLKIANRYRVQSWHLNAFGIIFQNGEPLHHG